MEESTEDKIELVVFIFLALIAAFLFIVEWTPLADYFGGEFKIVDSSIMYECRSIIKWCQNIINYSINLYPSPAVNCTEELIFPYGTQEENLPSLISIFSNFSINDFKMSKFKYVRNECFSVNKTSYKNLTSKWNHYSERTPLIEVTNYTWNLPNGTIMRFNTESHA